MGLSYSLYSVVENNGLQILATNKAAHLDCDICMLHKFAGPNNKTKPKVYSYALKVLTIFGNYLVSDIFISY